MSQSELTADPAALAGFVASLRKISPNGWPVMSDQEVLDAALGYAAEGAWVLLGLEPTLPEIEWALA